MTQPKIKVSLFVLLLVVAGMGCRLISPTPASWSGTPTAKAREATNAAFELTQQAQLEDETDVTLIPTPTLALPTTTPQPTLTIDGPWLVYPAPGSGKLQAYDVDADTTLEIALPEPIYTTNLVSGLSPDGQTLVVRAGSPLNTDELALYQINLPSTEIIKITPLLSITVQRMIVNEEGTRAFDTLRAVTRPDGLAWSPDGRFLAFTAALDNNSSDLYVVDTEKDRIERLGGLYSQSASPFWAPGSNWLVSQELGDYDEETGWRSEVVSGLRIPGYDDQNSFYLPLSGSQEEVFLGWTNAQNFISYSQTADGPLALRQVNVDTLSVGIVLQNSFARAAFDPVSKSLAFVLSDEDATSQGLIGGVYLLRPESPSFSLQRAGDWSHLTWDPGGMFVASSPQGALAFTPEGESILLQDEAQMALSPSGNWIVAWGDGTESTTGARLYQSPSGNRLQEIMDLQVGSVFWQPDSKAFFLFAEGSLYHLAFPSLNLVEINTEFSEDQTLEMIWVE